MSSSSRRRFSTIFLCLELRPWCFLHMKQLVSKVLILIAVTFPMAQVSRLRNDQGFKHFVFDSFWDIFCFPEILELTESSSGETQTASHIRLIKSHNESKIPKFLGLFYRFFSEGYTGRLYNFFRDVKDHKRSIFYVYFQTNFPNPVSQIF